MKIVVNNKLQETCLLLDENDLLIFTMRFRNNNIQQILVVLTCCYLLSQNAVSGAVELELFDNTNKVSGHNTLLFFLILSLFSHAVVLLGNVIVFMDYVYLEHVLELLPAIFTHHYLGHLLD